MPKIRTNRGAAKRFKLTKSGKIKRAKAYKSHLLTSKNAQRKRNLRAPIMVSSSAEVKMIKKICPYL